MRFVVVAESLEDNTEIGYRKGTRFFHQSMPADPKRVPGGKVHLWCTDVDQADRHSYDSAAATVRWALVTLAAGEYRMVVEPEPKYATPQEPR